MERDLMDLVKEEAENRMLAGIEPPCGLCGQETRTCPPPWEEEEPADWHDAPACPHTAGLPHLTPAEWTCARCWPAEYQRLAGGND